MNGWQDSTYQIASDAPMEVNEEGTDRVEIAWMREASNSALSLIVDRAMARELHRKLARILYAAPVEAGIRDESGL